MSKTAELKETLKTAKARMNALVAEQDAIIESVKTVDAGPDGDGNPQLSIEHTTEQKDTFKANIAEMKDLAVLIDGMEVQVGAKDYLGRPAGSGFALATAAGAALANGAGSKTIGQLFVESEEFRSMLGGKAGYTMAVPFEMKVADLAGHAFGAKSTSDIFTASPTGTPGDFGTTTRVPMVGRPQRSFRVRDLFPVVSTDSRVIEYFRVTGFTNNASPTPERDGSNNFQAKPQSTMTFVGEQAVVRTIAHWIAVHRNTLADEAQLRAVIDSELLYGLQLREDQQILSGAGTSEDLLGILNVSGVQTQARGSDTNADAIRKAITKVALAEYEATGIVLHPSNWEKVELERVNGTSPQQYVNAIVTNIATGAEPRLWRLPLVITQAITSGTGLVGAFGLGATLYDREEANIRVAEQHDDFFVKNAVVVLAEQREALTVQRPEAFCSVTSLQ